LFGGEVEIAMPRSARQFKSLAKMHEEGEDGRGLQRNEMNGERPTDRGPNHRISCFSRHKERGTYARPSIRTVFLKKEVPRDVSLFHSSFFSSSVIIISFPPCIETLSPPARFFFLVLAEEAGDVSPDPFVTAGLTKCS